MAIALLRVTPVYIVTCILTFMALQHDIYITFILEFVFIYEAVSNVDQHINPTGPSYLPGQAGQ